METQKKNVLYLWNGKVFFATNQMQTEVHSHYAATLAISLEKPFSIQYKGEEREYRVAFLGPNTVHKTVSPDVAMVALLIDPETYEFQSLAGRFLEDTIVELDIGLFQKQMLSLSSLYHGRLSPHEAYKLLLDLLQSIHSFPNRKLTMDPRMQKLGDQLRKELPSQIKMSNLKKDLGLSEDHIIKLFKESFGIPLRRYLLWLRLLRAVEEISSGNNLTEAAHAAGFSDSAHFSRTFKENFGFVPSLFFGHLRESEIYFCEST
ncbi:DNA-binding helix-turn-helix protein [Leptospira ryugenii]|uniref:DNA-binding helix-turn-helix protein n=1 Tax=Leptospira ryugenii TaxID=1917863 RepID=A0A2P2DZP8_9LEPT|nr:AraC family transcriptional regulator [Leptospira ryugenii]GBF50108.1 DNA-binding helix-turn-helix protein [Leptospira ryugenii]